MNYSMISLPQTSSADPFSSDPFAPTSSMKSPVLSTKKSSNPKSKEESSEDPFFGGSSQSAWSDPFGSGHPDPFSNPAVSSPSNVEDAWAAFGEAKKVNSVFIFYFGRLYT